MAARIHKESSKGKSETAQETPDKLEVDQDAKDKLDYDIDGLLDKLDDVLEVNAEDFVNAFIQKGGE
ncbi:MAG: ubiquitin-like protein Pup [Candidatus Saccharimonadales bacterium]